MATKLTETKFLKTLPQQDGKPHMRFGRLRVERKLADGQMSAVYLAQHLGLDLPVILRVMHPETRTRLKSLDALMQSGRQIARVRHQSIATIYDLGFHQEHPYMILQFVSGVPIVERMKVRPYTETEALQLLTPVADGLGAYWRRGLLHRGVCPRRISVASDGVPMLDVVIMARTLVDPVVTQGHVRFMAGFWPPEELQSGLSLDPRSDMFSFGASLYYALTGISPFGKGANDVLMERTLKGEPRDPLEDNPDMNPDVAGFISRCLQRNPGNRFGSINEFLAALRDLPTRLSNMTLGRLSDSMPAAFARKASARTVFGEGDVVGNCKLQKRVGTGAFGIVYRARHLTLDIDVAVKLLPIDIAEKDPTYIRLFLREARTAARIRHPNVIGIFEAGSQEGQYYLVMEYAPYGTVLDRMNENGGSLPVEDVIDIFQAAAEGLAAAEAHKIIHRDIKPENLMFGNDDVIKISDLGLAKRLPENDGVRSPTQAEELPDDLITRNQNDPSTIMGTPAYMSPEMATDPITADTRSDMYSLGITVYQMLTGKLPFKGNSALETLLKHIRDKPEPPEKLNPKIPRKLSRIVMRLLAKDPKDRYQSAEELMDVVVDL